jgi:exosortase
MALLFWVLTLILFWAPLTTLTTLSVGDDRYTHIVLIPFLSAGLIYLDRQRIFGASGYSLRVGIPLVALGVSLYFLTAASQQYRLPLSILGVIVTWGGGIACFFGARALRAAAFPVTFLLLMIPIPLFVLSRMVAGLQEGSAEISSMLYRLIRVPNFREDLEFLLPGVRIRIAEECSGIRSSQSLFIFAIIGGHIFLRSGWKTALITLFTVPLTIFKNAVRIVTLSTLAVYVSRDFLYGNLHHYGGLVFSLLDVVVLIPLIALRRARKSRTVPSIIPAANNMEAKGSR